VSSPAGANIGVSGWRRRLEDPFNVYYRYPVALFLVRLLIPTPITPNQVSLSQPVLAALAGYLVSSNDPGRILLAVAVFEFRSILDCVDGSLARAKKMSSPNGHAIDAMADWLGVVFLYVGLLMHFRAYPPDAALGWLGGGPATHVTTTLVLAASGAQAALRSFGFDYFKSKYLAIYEKGKDDSIEGLAAKVRSLRAYPTVFGRVDVFIGRFGHLFFEREWFDPDTSTAALSPAEVDRMSREQDSPRARFMGFLWSVSGGDAYLSMVMLSIVFGQMWSTQVFFATFGFAWILAVMIFNVHFVRTGRRGYATVAA
jgi:phosphatidylglycerophosphate synthase